MNDDMRIEETNKFGELSSFLNASLSDVDSYETKLNNIGKGLSGELGECYAKAAGPVKEKIASIRSDIKGAISHIDTSVSVCLLADDKLKDKLNDLLDSIFGDRELTDDEMTSLIMGLASSSGTDTKELKDLVNSTDLLNKEDKKYIIEQLAKGNIRAGIGRMLSVQAKQDLKDIEEKNNKKIKEINDKLLELRNEKENFNIIYGYDQGPLYSKDIDKQINELNKKIKDLKNEITNQRLIVYQYKNSEKEWEYDYLLAKVGTKEFEDVVSKPKNVDTLNRPLRDTLQELDALKYFDEDHLKVYKYLYNSGDESGAKEYLNTFSDYFNQCHAQEDANRIVRRIASGENISNVLGDLTSFFEGTGVGIEGWFENVGNLLSTDGKMTKSEYTQMYVNNMLGGLGLLAPVDFSEDLGITSSNYNKLKKKYGDSFSYLDILHESNQISDTDYNNLIKLKDDKNINNFVKNADVTSTFGKTRSEWLTTFFGAGVSTGNMIPAVVASYLTSGLLSEAGVAASTVANASRATGLSAMFLGCVSSSKNEALRSGRSIVEAYAYGILSGLSETAIEYLIGGIPGLSRLDNMVKLAPTSNKFELIGKMLLNTLVINPGQEITEEMVQALILDPVVETLAFGEKTSSTSLDDALEIALQTYFSTVGLGGFSMVSNFNNAAKTSNAKVGVYTLADGTNVDVTYGMLMDCIDKETGKISTTKMEEMATKASEAISLKDVVEGITSIFSKAGTVAVKGMTNGIMNGALSNGSFSNGSNASTQETTDIVVNTDPSDTYFGELLSKLHDKNPLAKIFSKNGEVLFDPTKHKSTTSLDTESTESYDASTMPLSSDPEKRRIQLKALNGEELGIFEQLKLGRDNPVHEVDGKETKSDHAYRAMSVEEYLAHEETGTIEGLENDHEYMEYEVDGETHNNNAGVDWYLGGVDPKYGKVIIEAPALKKYFTTASDEGNSLSADPKVKHLKSSTHDNPVPLSVTSVVAGADLIAKAKEQIALKKKAESPIMTSAVVNPELVELVNTDAFQSASVDEQKAMISKISDYDSLPVETRLQIFKELLEKNAAKKGMTIKELGNQDGNGIVDPNDQAEANALATDKRSRAEVVEPAITKIMETLQDDDSVLIGLKYRLKGKESIARKIIFDHNHSGVSLTDANARINDSVRYTMLTDEDNYVEKAKQTLKTLQDAGYEITAARNTWDNPYYKGVNTTLKTPDGVVFELQFHTTDSFIIKDCESHVYYEIRRNEYVGEEDKALATEIQGLYSSTIPIPAGVLGFDFKKYLEDVKPLEVESDLSNKGNANYTLSKSGEYVGSIDVDVAKSGTSANMDMYVTDEYVESDLVKDVLARVVDDILVKKVLDGTKKSSSVVANVNEINLDESSETVQKSLKTLKELGFSKTKKGISIDIETLEKRLKAASKKKVVTTRENQDIRQIVSNVDGNSVVDNMRAAGISEDIIGKFTNSLEKAKEIIGKCKVYDPKLTQEELVKQMAIDYGDAREEVNKLLMDGKTADDIREILKDRPQALEEFEKFLKDTVSGQFIATLNGRKIRGIDSYSGGNLHNIQNALRKLRDNSPHMIIAEDISEALAGAPSLGEATLLYRGDNPKSLLHDKTFKDLLNGYDLEDNNEVVKALQGAIGLSINDLGFVSTSPGYNTSFAGRDNKRVVFEIIAPEGTNGAYINQISEFYNKENEYLLNYKTNQRILDVYLGEDGKVHIVTIVEK